MRELDLRLVAYEPAGPRIGALPDPSKLDVSFVHNDVGALSVEYSTLAAAGDVVDQGLGEGLEIAAEVGVTGTSTWVEPDGGRFLLLKRSRDRLDQTSTLSLTLPGFGWLARKARNLDVAHLQPADATNAGKRQFSAANAGVILGTLLDENAARGGIPLTRGFDTALDSAGATWALVVTIAYELGVGVDTVLDNLAAQGMLDWRTRARTLRAWNADTVCAPDLSGSVRLHLHRDVTDAPQEESLEEVVSRLMIRGDAGLVLTETNPTAPTPWGPWEGYLSQAGVSDSGTAHVLVQAELARTARVRGQYTRALVLGADQARPDRPLPMVDYTPGAWITAPTVTTSGERVRVQQITLSRSKEGVTGNVVLNDRLLDAELRRTKRLVGVVGGSTAAGGSGAALSPEGPDNRVPAAPTGLVVDSDSYIDPDGAARGVLTATWSAVTTATDGTALDVVSYDLAVREDVTGAPWSIIALATSTTVAVSPLEPGKALLVRVRATGRYTTAPGDWSASAAVTIAADTTPPPVPSTPVLSTRLGTVTVAWDGLTIDGGTMPSDFERVDVYQESSGLVIGALRASAGSDFLVVTTATYNVADRYRFKAVDRSGNASAFTAWRQITTAALVNADLIGQVIANANIVDGTIVASSKIVAGTVTTATLAALAVTADKVAANAITADKIEAGSITAVKVAAGVIDTSKLTLGVLQSNRVLNPGFEERGAGGFVPNAAPGSIPGWLQSTPGQGGAFEWSNATFPPRSGQGCAVTRTLPSGAFAGYLRSQPCQVAGGRQYRVEGWAAAHTYSGGATAVLDLWWVDAAGALTYALVGAAVVTPAWQKFSALLTAPASAVSVIVLLSCSGPTVRDWYVRWDDIAVVEVGSSASEITPGGLRMWNSAGTPTIDINGETATVTAGIFESKSAASNATYRIRVDAAGFWTERYGTVPGMYFPGTGSVDAANYWGGIYAEALSTVIDSPSGGAGRRSEVKVGADGVAVYVGNDFTHDYSRTLVLARPQVGLEEWHIGSPNNGAGEIIGWKSSGGQKIVNAYGDFYVTNGTKYFSMDHPTKPGMTLLHAATESPRPGVHYWSAAPGMVGPDGTATVELPEYFEALTERTGRAVIVSCVGDPHPIGADEISAGAFTVRGEPGQQFTWLVHAARSGYAFEAEVTTASTVPAPAPIEEDTHG